MGTLSKDDDDGSDGSDGSQDIVGACGQISLQLIRFSEFSYEIVFKKVSLRVKRTPKTHFRKALPQSPAAEFGLKSTDATFPFVA